jgi:hypothetical protein
MGLDVSIRTFASPTALETSADLRIGADVQIGGGVRVSDAFPAIVGFEPIAIWVMQFCVEISQARRSCLVVLKREIRNSRAGGGNAERASGF